MLMNAWMQIQAVIPAASRAPNVSGAASADPDPLVGDDDEQDDDEAAADEPEFLADDGEDEVVVGVRQEQPAGEAALAEPGAEDAAEAERQSPWIVWKPAPAGSLHGSRKALHPGQLVADGWR